MSDRKAGLNFEYRTGRALQELYPKARKSVGQNATVSQKVPDVDGTPYWIECKFRKTLNVRAIYEEHMEKTDGRPVLVVWRNRGTRGKKCKTLVIMDWETWFARERLITAQLASTQNSSSEISSQEKSHNPTSSTTTAEILINQSATHPREPQD